jgi:hypothetical protein
MTELDLADRVAAAMTLDPTRSNIGLFVGGKGSGKSTGARTLFDAWPSHRMVIDPTGDARPDDPATVSMTTPVPSQIPELRDDDGNLQRFTGWARLDPRSPTYTADLNAGIGMALYPRRWHKLLWIDEYGLGTSAQQAKGTENDRTMCMSSRHYNLSALLCLPRPKFINKLAIINSDFIVMHRLADVDDREYVAKNAGVPFRIFERTYQANRHRGKHAFVLFHRELELLLDCPPLPNIVARGPKA